MARITIRYFQVTKRDGHQRTFSDALRAVENIKVISQREKQLDDFKYRLERFSEEKSGLIFGEMTKIQDDNLPSEAIQEGLIELDADRLGYGVAFAYDEQLSVLAIQYDNRVVSVSRVGGYLHSHDSRNGFYFLPIPGEDSWGKFSSEGVKKFKLRVALPNSFSSGVNNAMGKSISSLARTYQSPYVTIEVGVGHKKVTLSDTIRDVAKRFINTDPVESMKAVTIESEGEIDLLEEILKDRDEIDIPSDPEQSYSNRSSFVARGLTKRRAYISQMFGKD